MGEIEEQSELEGEIEEESELEGGQSELEGGHLLTR